MIRSMVVCCAASGAFLLSGAVLAQRVSLVADINQQPAHHLFCPEFTGAQGGVALFQGVDERHGLEPWISDGTSAGTRLLADMQPGPTWSESTLLGRLGNRVVFASGLSLGTMSVVAVDLLSGEHEVLTAARVPEPRFRSDGFRFPARSAVVGDAIVFAARLPDSGTELWITRGTRETTHLLVDIDPGDDSSAPTEFFAAGGVAYFAARREGLELWRTDGTVEGTFIVFDSPLSSGLEPTEFVAVGDDVYFFATGVQRTGRELWKTDGTASGTVLVHEIAPGNANSNALSLSTDGTSLYFWATVQTNRGYFAYDIEAGELAFLAPYPSSSPPPATTSAGAFFIRTTPEHGDELWRTDGTLAGTVLVRDINPGPEGGVLHHPVAVGERVVFRADDGKTGSALWSSDGTSEGTVRLVSAYDWLGLTPGPLIDGALLVTLNDGVNGWTLWRTDGTPAGTFPLIPPPPASAEAGSLPRAVASLDGEGRTIVYTANDGTHGNEPWVISDESPTRMIRDIQPGAGTGAVGPYVLSGDQMFFVGNDGATGNEVWRTDGTEAGTRLVRDVVEGPGGFLTTRLAPVPGGVVFGALTSVGNSLWFTDGTATNTRTLQTFTSTTAFDLHSHAGRAYFATVSGLLTNALRSTDGTSVQNVATVSGSMVFTTQYNVARVGETVVFVAFDISGAEGFQLWARNGAGAPTRLGDILPGPGSPDISLFTQTDALAYFTAFSSSAGYELWRNDGTVEGTAVALDIVPGAESSMPLQLTAAGGSLFFSAWTPETGRELWVTDGTPAGTRLVADINPGTASSTPLALAPVGSGRIVFSALTPERGTEMWESDGTAAGTRLITDIIPGPGSAGPSEFFAAAEGVIFFSATDGVRGRELWQYDPNGCPCDWDGTGTLNSGDFFAFLGDFFGGAADFNASGVTDSGDFFDFLTCFFGSCP